MVGERELAFGVRNIRIYTRAVEYFKDMEQWRSVACLAAMSDECWVIYGTSG